jgi:hypothetical protein
MRRIFTAIRGITWFVGVLRCCPASKVSNILSSPSASAGEIDAARGRCGARAHAAASCRKRVLCRERLQGVVAGVIAGDHRLRRDKQAMLARPQVDFGVVVLATLVLMLAGIVAGFLPARRAVQVRTVDALRTEVG